MARPLVPAAPAQSVLYRYLAEGFSFPSRERLDYLEAALGTAALACEEMTETVAADAPLPDFRALHAALGAARAGIADIQAEYTHLFVAGFPTTPCRLVESVHLENRLVGQATEKVAIAYLRFGLEAKEQEPDNLTSELEFLAYLTGTPIDADTEMERYRDARAMFLEEHLLRWGPALVRRVKESASAPLYPVLANLLGWLLQADASGLSPTAGRDFQSQKGHRLSAGGC